MPCACLLYTSGNVVDSNNEPVIGAYIKVKGSNRGAVTDLDGHYTIDPDKNATLVISYVGDVYKSQAYSYAILLFDS